MQKIKMKLCNKNKNNTPTFSKNQKKSKKVENF